MSEPRVMTDASHVLKFLFAGNATLTLKSLASGEHRTYKIGKADDKDLWFVSLLTAPDHFTYIGVIDGPDRSLRLTKKSKMTMDAPAVKAFIWSLAHLKQNRIPQQLEIRHEGRCGRCNRPLTHPDSIDRGIGPDCAEIMGLL